jgi:hypothetical protein
VTENDKVPVPVTTQLPVPLKEEQGDAAPNIVALLGLALLGMS